MNYSGFGTGRRKKKTAITAVVIVAVVLFLGIYAIGLTLGSDSEARVAISEAIEENARLKNELMEKDTRINQLTERIKELENAAVQEEEDTAEQSGAEELPRQGSPRE